MSSRYDESCVCGGGCLACNFCLIRTFPRLSTKNNTIVTPQPGDGDFELFMITLFAGFETVFFKNTMFRNNDWLGNPVATVSSSFEYFFQYNVM